MIKHYGPLAFLCSLTLSIQANYTTVGSHLLANLPATPQATQITSTFNQYKTALAILQTASQQQKTVSNPPLNDTTIRDLNILFYHVSKPKFTILNKIKRTQTVLGTCELANILLTPLTDKVHILSRQNIIKLLVTNDEVRTTLKSIVSNFAPQEEQLLSLWNPEDNLYGKNMRLTFFGDNIKGKEKRSKFLVEFLTRYQDGLSIFSSALGFLILHATQKLTNSKAASLAKWIIPLFGLIISVPNALNNYKNRSYLIKLARQRLRSLVSLSTAARSLERWGHDYATHAKKIPIMSMVNSFTSASNKPIHDFLSSLASSSFDIHKGYLSSFAAPVLHAIPTFLTLKDRLCPILQAIGHIDALISIAELYREHTDTTRRYCFAQYHDDAPGPMLHATNIWHPALDPQVAVSSSIYLGGANYKRNMVITGANAGGKSTLSKAMMLNALLAQTLTIAPADSIQLTPFTILNTYLNIVDDFSVGVSQHRAEVRRTVELVNSITQLQPDQYALTIMDEMFRCTNPTTGSAAAFGIGKVLGSLSNSLLVMATHFAKLTNLAYAPQSSFSNHRVNATKKADGSFQFHYRLEPGINEKVIALDLLANEGFDDAILTYANQHLSRMRELEREILRDTAPDRQFTQALADYLSNKKSPL